MVKQNGQSARPRRLAPGSRGPALAPPEAPLDTRTKILEAAYRRLAKDGYAALRMREIADEAGVNHALINYNFRTKEQLVIAVLDTVNDRLVQRQRSMYQGPGGLAAKWATARRFYESDLASGYCRVLMELLAASMSNEMLRNELRPRMDAWHQVVLEAVREAIRTYQLDLPVSAEVLTVWIGNFWMGLELAMLTGIPTPAAPHDEALGVMQRILERLDARAEDQAREAGRTQTTGKSPTRAAQRGRKRTLSRRRT